jgi:hypothetical protein
MVGFLMSSDPNAENGDIRNIYRVGQNTSRVLLATGDLVVAWLLIKQAAVAMDQLGGDLPAGDRFFYEGKVAAAEFFARQVLPKLSAERAIAESTDNALMDLDEAAF